MIPNDIPLSLEDMQRRLLDSKHELTRIERAYLCGFLTGIEVAEKIAQEEESEELEGLQ